MSASHETRWLDAQEQQLASMIRSPESCNLPPSVAMADLLRTLLENGETMLRRSIADGLISREAEHGTKVGEIEQKQPFVVGDPEDHLEDAFLRVVELEDAGEQGRAHFRHGGAHRR